MEPTAQQIEVEEHFDVDYYLDTDDKCPDCGTLMKVCYRAVSPEDAVREWVCPGCGLTETE